MPQTTDQLKPCPFCGSQAELVDRQAGPLLRGAYVICDCCKASQGITVTAQESRAAWNRRAVPLVAEAPREPPLPEGWATEALEAIWNAPIGTTITADMKRAASLALRVARGERWDDASQEWGAPPGSLSEPEIDRDSDGELLIDWAPAEGRMLTMSLRPDGRLSYAFQWDGDKAHGHAQMPPSVSLAPMPEEWLKEAERLIDMLETQGVTFGACPTVDINKQNAILVKSRAALLSHLRTAPLTLSDEQRRAAFNAGARWEASVAPQPEQPNADSVHLADNGEQAVQGLDAAAGVGEDERG